MPVIFDLTAPLQSERLIIRPVNQDDLAALLDVHGIDEVTRFTAYSTWKSMEDVQAWYGRISAYHIEDKARHFVIVSKKENIAIGTCLLFEFDQSGSRAEIGFVLGRRYWGQGLMREALKVFLSHIFKNTSLRRIEAQVDPRNAASDRLLISLGFVREGLLRQRWVARDEIRDIHIYGLLKTDWPAADPLSCDQ